MGFFDFLNKTVDTAEINPVITKIAEQAYFKEMALHIGISYIANTISKCEFKVYEDNKEVHNELYYAWNVSPNPNQNSSQFINKLVEKYYYDASSLVIPSGNKLYVADGFQKDKKPMSDDRFCNISVEDKQLSKQYKASDVFYFKLDDKNVKGLIDGLYNQYGLIMSYAISAYKRSNGKQYKLILNNYKAGDKGFAEAYEGVIKKQLQSFMENDNTVYPQFKETTLEQIGDSKGADSTDIIAMRKEIFETTAQALKIPQSMMYGNITNMNEIVKVYLSICIDPIADMISEEITRKTNTFESWSKGSYVKVDTSCINHLDILEVADKADKLISSGVASIDEVRGRLDMDALNTEFSGKHFITKNYLAIEEALKDMEGGEQNNG